ncbi:MAG: radical SAM protein [Candidatus Woesearchaeota archaeon]|nr:radical SAM protein [Candidatus Woesearchaeota archaeon]
MAKQKNYKIALFSLPPYQPVYMHPAVPYLTGYLKKYLPDVEVVQKDLNTGSLDYFLGSTPKFMRNIASYRDFQGHKQARRELSARIEHATEGRLHIVRNTVNYDLAQTGEDYKSRTGLLQVAQQKERNLFYEYFRTEVLPSLEGVNLVGLSVSDQKQLVPTMVLASVIKEQYPDTKVVIGGNIITRNYDVLSQDNELNRRLFDHFDYLVHHEGEVAIKELVERLKEGKAVEGVPKLIYRDGGRIKENLRFVVENVNAIPAPDLDDLVAQGNHWTPELVIPYLIGRGCDWGGCNFCDIPAGYDGSRTRMEKVTGKKFEVEGSTGKRRVQDLDKVIEDLRDLKERYSTKYFSFGDEELAGDSLRDFVDKILESDLDIEWECYGRIEDIYLDKDFCKRLREAGCRFIQFGIESASQKVLDTSNKGYKSGLTGRVLRNTYETGIMNHAFILIGLPDDSIIEASRLITFLEETAQYITTMKPIMYKVSKWSPMALKPETFGLMLDKENTPDLEQRISVEKDSGMMSRHKAGAFVRLLELWVAQHHKVNPATSEYMFAQRLFLSRDELEEFGRSVDYQVELGSNDLKAIKRVFHGLVQELKTKAYDGAVNRDIRIEYEQMYLELKDQRAPENLEEIISLLRKTASVNY